MKIAYLVTNRNERTDMPTSTVLLIEDDELIGKLLQFILQREGYQVNWLKDGQSALQAIMQPGFSAVVLDLMLPFLDGIQLLDQLRLQPHGQKLPVLILTAKMGEADITAALKKGADDYLIKPFQPAEFSARLRRLMERH